MLIVAAFPESGSMGTQGYVIGNNFNIDDEATERTCVFHRRHAASHDISVVRDWILALIDLIC